MTPLSVTIERFGSFVEEQTFEFPEGPGLFFMQGRNEVEPKLGSNGSGKSTLWKAITWCLFGKDPKGLKAGDVANWDTPKGAMVSFSYDIGDGYIWTVERKHSPNSWMLYWGCEDDPGGSTDLTKDETNPVLDHLRLEYETWLQCVLLAQGEPYFLDLKADAKAAVFSEVMGLDRWLKYSVRASDRVKDIELLERAIERSLAEVVGKLAGMTATFHVERTQWEAKRERDLDDLAARHEEGSAKSEALKKELDAANTDADFAHSGVVGMQEKIDAAMAEVERLTEVHGRRVDAFTTIRERLRAIDEQRDNLRDAKACPLCGTVGQHLKNVRADLKATALALESEVESVQRQADLAAKDLRAATNRLQQAQGAAQTALTAVDRCQRTVTVIRNDYERQERLLDDIEDEAERRQAEVNPFAELAARAARDRRELEVERAALEDRHLQAAERGALLGFWVRGFKDVRLGLIAEALDQYALEANSCAAALGLDSWELVFEVDRETKAGSVKSGFNVFVKSPHNDKQVPWEAWSGGESQRLRLAAQLGLSNLIRATTGADMALEVWDEPTEGMSDRGIADLLDALRERARIEQRQIWVVDHRVLGYADWNGGVTVVKTPKGSRFER